MFHVFVTIQTFSKSYFSLPSIGQGSKQIFCSFPSNFFKGFWLLRLVRPFCPSFFIYFHVLCIFFMHFGKISNLRKIVVFVNFNLFIQNWSLGFCYEMLLNCSLVLNLINSLIWEKLNFSRAWNYMNWGFCSIEHNLVKLAC